MFVLIRFLIFHCSIFGTSHLFSIMIFTRFINFANSWNIIPNHPFNTVTPQTYLPYTCYVRTYVCIYVCMLRIPSNYKNRLIFLMKVLSLTFNFQWVKLTLLTVLWLTVVREVFIKTVSLCECSVLFLLPIS